jgi:hypothetical protein
LCPGTAWSRMDLDWSTLKTTSGMSSTFLAGCGAWGCPGVSGALLCTTRRGRRGAGTSAKPARGNGRAWQAVRERLARREGPHTLWTLLRSRSERGVGGVGGWVLLFLLAAHRQALRARGPATGRSTRRLGGALGSGKARVGGIRWRGTWPPARGHPVDHLRVVAACLLTGQHPGKRLGCPVGHRHGEDPLGVPTAARARHRRRGRPHRHPLLETAAVIAAIVVDGH